MLLVDDMFSQKGYHGNCKFSLLICNFLVSKLPVFFFQFIQWYYKFNVLPLVVQGLLIVYLAVLKEFKIG